MKLPLHFAALLFASASITHLLAQGLVNWGNSLPATPTTPQVRAPIYGVDPANPYVHKTGNTATGLPPGTQTYGGPLLSGTGFTMAIYFGRTAAECMANNSFPTIGGMTTFRTGNAAGFVNQFTATVDSIPGGTTGVNYQLRAWDNQNGTITSWSQVLASGGMIPFGISDVYILGEALSAPPSTPPYAAGIRSFQFEVTPEPSLIALGALGLGALLLCRRRNG